MSDEPSKPATAYPDLFVALCEPFGPMDVKTRPQGGRQLKYITARSAMNRLDEVLGPENWWDSYEIHERSVLCKLTIRLPDGMLLTKQDAGGAAGMSDPGDDEKSAFSDSFKRACVKFGVGRHLYNDGVPGFAESAASASHPQSDGGPTPPTLPDPKTGKHFFKWVRDLETLHGVVLLKTLNEWAKSAQYPGRMVDWDADQIAVGVVRVKTVLGQVSSTPAASATPPGSETGNVPVLADAPTFGKALFAAVRTQEDRHSIAILKPLNAWAKAQGRTDKMTEWPPDFVAKAWGEVSRIVHRHGDKSAISPANGTGPTIKQLRAELWKACCEIVRVLDGIVDGNPPDPDRAKTELAVVAGMLEPGRAIHSSEELTDAADVQALIDAASERLREVREAKEDIPF